MITMLDYYTMQWMVKKKMVRFYSVHDKLFILNSDDVQYLHSLHDIPEK